MQPSPQLIPKWIPAVLSSLIVVSVLALTLRSRISHWMGWNEVPQTIACHQVKPRAEINVAPQFTRLVVAKKIQLALLSGSQLCLRKGQLVSIMPRLDEAVWVLRRKIGTAKVSTIRGAAWEQIDKRIIRQLGYTNTNSLKRDLMAEFGPDIASQSLVLVTFDLLKNDYFDTRSPIVPFETPYARSVNRDWTLHLLKKKVRVYDVRPRMAFLTEHLPGAISTPYHFGKYPNDIIYARYDKMLKQGDALNLDSFPTDKQTPFILYGQNPTDVGALRALAILHRYGWKNIFWYWGGMDDWMKRPIIPPAQDPRIQIISADSLEKMLPAGAHLVDVRQPAIFQKGRIPNAQNVPVALRSLPNNPQRTSLAFDPQQLPAQRQSLLIFYGENDLSWEPYQAALWARANGWQNVYWLRGGFSHWRAAGELFRNRYRWIRSRTNASGPKSAMVGQ